MSQKNNEVPREEFIKTLDFFQDRISTQTRVIVFGILGILWGVVFSSGGEVTETFNRFKSDISTIVIIGILILIIDYLQYLSGFINVKKTLVEYEKKENSSLYFKKDVFYKLTNYLFYAKIIILSYLVFNFFSFIVFVFYS